MDGNMSEDDSRNKGKGNTNLDEEPLENAKRLKTDINCILHACTAGNLDLKPSDCASTSSSSQNNMEESRDNNEGSLSPEEGNKNDKNKPNKVYDASSENSDHTSYMEHSSVIIDSDSETESEPAVLRKEKPKHNWFVVKEVLNRQLGRSNKFKPELFNSRCYGSLHCVQRLELMYKLEEHAGCVNSLNFNADGSLLASGSDDLKVVVWDWKCGKSLLSFDTKHKSNVFQSKFLQLDGDLHIATCSRDGQVRLAQVSRQEGLRSSRKLGSHRGPCHKLAVLKDQPQIVLSAGEDGLIFKHDLRQPKPERVTNVKTGEKEIALYSINSHPLNPNEFCVGGRDSMVRTYDQRKCGPAVEPLQLYYPFKKSDRCLPYHVTCAVYNHNGSEILASYNDEDIYLFDVNGREEAYLHRYMGHRNGATIKGVNFFGPKSEFIVSGSDCGNVFFWDSKTEAIVQWFYADDNGVVNCLEPHPQVPYICTSGLDWDVKVWVPSFENEPEMKGLSDTVKENVSARSQWAYSSDNDSQMLWMLWRHLNSRERLRRDFGVHGWTDPSSDNSSSSTDNIGSDSENDSEYEVSRTRCAPS